MRSRFDEQLEAMKNELITMGALCESAIASAAKALTDGDHELAKAAIAADSQVDEKEREIETLCLKLLLQQQPVAKDLRKVSSALKMITDMERIGDQAADIAEIVTMANIVASDDTLSIAQMARETIRMVRESIDAYVRQDITTAKFVIDYDDVVDELFDKVKSELIEMLGTHPHRSEYVLDLLMIAKYFERIGDHATNIAEWVVFSITGSHKLAADPQ